MAWLERLCEPILDLADKLHIFRRDQLAEWESTQQEAEAEITRIHEANVRDVEHMSDEERSRLPRRTLEDVWLGRNGGRHG